MDSGDVVPGCQLLLRLLLQSVKVLRPWDLHSTLLGESLCFTILPHVWCCSKLREVRLIKLELSQCQFG